MSLHIKHINIKRFNEWAHQYDKSVLQHLVFRASHNMFLNHIIPYFNDKNDIKLLDVGCGTGKFIFGLSDCLKGKHAEIHGVDLSFDMIRMAKAKLNHSRIKFKVGDVEELPYGDNTFDVITCSNSFHHYPDKKKAIKEMHRVLKHEGRLMIIDGCRDVPLGNAIFKVVEIIEKHAYHMLAHEFRDIFSQTGFHQINQERFNLIPLLLTTATAKK